MKLRGDIMKRKSGGDFMYTLAKKMNFVPLYKHEKSSREQFLEDFDNFIETNKDKIHCLAESNTKRDSDGNTVICKDDSWFSEDDLYNQ